MKNNFNNFELNEYIGEGKDPFIDDRGKILNYYLNNKVNQVGLIDSKRGSVRGNHYHPDQLQTCILIKGSYISVTKNLEDDSAVIESRLVKEGQVSIIKPNIAHTMVFIEDSVFINLVDGEREHENYGETHTFPIEIVDNFLAESIVECFKDNCRVCNSRNLILIHSFGLSPLANNLVDGEKSKATTYPLELNYCKDCNNIQLNIVVDPTVLFDKYLYTSSTSQSFVDHFTELASNLIKEFNLDKESVVVDIGSNDGIFLKPLVDRNIKSIGVEPATNLALDANKNNLETINSYFDKQVVQRIIQKYGKVDIVTAFNVFAHSDKLKDLANDAFSLLKEDGVFIIEVQSLAEMIEKNLFDNVYHEHVNYWSLTNLVSFFEKLGFFVNNFQKVETHGGSLRLFVSRKKKIKSAVSEYIKYEENLGLNKLDTFYSFSKKIIEQKNLALENINNLKKSGKKIIFYGAPAKATTLLNYYGINSKLVQFTIEDNPLKVGKYIPNTNIEIIDKEKAIELDPDVIIVLAWNFYEVIKNHNSDVFPNAQFIKLNH